MGMMPMSAMNLQPVRIEDRTSLRCELQLETTGPHRFCYTLIAKFIGEYRDGFGGKPDARFIEGMARMAVDIWARRVAPRFVRLEWPYERAGPAPITDSPWFWAYLFGTAALVALALAGSKYGPRQAQIEREFQGRQRATQNLNGREPDVALSTAERTLVSLQPLFIALAVITAGAWLVFWRQHRRGQQSNPASVATLPSPATRKLRA